METNPYLHEVAVTAIIVRDNKFLIIRRSLSKKRFPGMWTVPGGKLEVNDYASLPKDTQDSWYYILEKALKREVKEEVGIEIDSIEYLLSLGTVYADGTPSLVVSCMAQYSSGEVKLQEEETDQFEWVSLEEAKNYQLIEGIYEELLMADKKLKGEKVIWQRMVEN